MKAKHFTNFMCITLLMATILSALPLKKSQTIIPLENDFRLKDEFFVDNGNYNLRTRLKVVYL